MGWFLPLGLTASVQHRPGCPKLPCKPDESECDPKGELADSLGVEELPSAFLWPWSVTR